MWLRFSKKVADGSEGKFAVTKSEFHLLLKEEQTAAYSAEIWKRLRKWGGIPTGATQNPKDLHSSPEIENIPENRDFTYMLNWTAGFETVCQCEGADYPYAILQKHWPDVPKFRDITTFAKEAFLKKRDLKPSPSSPADSRASPFPLPDGERALRMNATCGRKCAALLPDCGPVGCLGKMLLASSIWDSTKQFLIWQKRDTLCSHSYFRLAASAHGMSASELLSSRLMFPTPLASDKSTGRDAASLDVYLSDNGIFRKRNKDGSIWSLSLSAAVFYLTPAASEGYRSTLKRRPSGANPRPPTCRLR